MSSGLPHGISNALCLCGASVLCVYLAVDQSGLDHGILLWVECHGGHGRPIAGLAAPAPWVALAGLLIEHVTTSQQRPVLSDMALCRRDVANAAVTVLVVVPMREVRGPTAGRGRGRQSPWAGRPGDTWRCGTGLRRRDC